MLATVLLLLSPAQGPVLFDFEKPGDSRWGTVHDTVMGGRSSGRASLTERGTLRFAGELSLANNGGFASFRSEGPAPAWPASDGVELRVRGDGRSYIFSVDRAQVPLFGGGYWQEFATEADTWTVVRLPWSDFQAHSFGKRMDGRPALTAETARALSVYLYDGQEGPFAIEFDRIGVYRDQDDADDPRLAALQRRLAESGADETAQPVLLPGYATLSELIEAAGLQTELASLDAPTVLAPTDAAFAALPAETVAALLREEHRALLREVLLGHVLETETTAFQALAQGRVRTLAGTTAAVGYDDGRLRLGGAEVSAADLRVDGLLVHQLDTVLVPADLTERLTVVRRSPVLRYLETVVEAGVPQFNGGDVAGCAQRYRSALQALLLLEQLPAEESRRVERTLESTAHRPAREAAWLLREAIDRQRARLAREI